MAKLKFIVKPQKGSNKTYIRARFTSSHFDAVASTGLEINPNYWNNKQGALRQRAEVTEVMRERVIKNLKGIRDTVESEYDKTPDKTRINTAWLKIAIDKYLNPSKYLQDDTTLFQYIQYFIDNATKRLNHRTGEPVSYKMRREYQVTFDYLKKYAKKYGEPDFVDIDMEFYERFIDLLRHEKLATNTIGKKIQTLKIFLNSATEAGINHYKKYKSNNFRNINEETENIYLTKDEIQQFYNHDFSQNQRLERVRDWFIIACWTAQRFSDLKQIKKEHIKGEYLILTQHKTKNKVTIPLHPMVKKILEKYSYNLPEPISNQKFNEYIQEAAEEAKLNTNVVKKVIDEGLRVEKKFKKHELITSHTGRRSFCTNMYKDGFPTISIMKISGHKSEKVFLQYIKASGEEHADMFLNKWKNEGEFLKVAK